MEFFLFFLSFFPFCFFLVGRRLEKNDNKKSHDKLKPKINILHRTELLCKDGILQEKYFHCVCISILLRHRQRIKFVLVFSPAVQSSRVKALQNTEECVHRCLLGVHHMWDSQCVILITPTPPPSRR